MKFIQLWHTKAMKVYYKPTSESFQCLLKTTDFGSMQFQPWFFAVNVSLQGIAFCFLEIYFKTFKKYEWSREILELIDGGEIALDWLINPMDKLTNNKSQRHIIFMIPGINGDSSCFYAVS